LAGVTLWLAGGCGDGHFGNRFEKKTR
jgi:hypothetical protein